MTDKHTFLSDEWIDEARRIREEYRGRTPAVTTVTRINLLVAQVPFGEHEHTTIELHLDSTTGDMELGLGHVEHPDVTLTVEYATARALLVEQNPQAAMQAFFGGKVKVEGDLAKLLALFTTAASTSDPAALAAATEAARKVKDMTL